MGSEGSGDQVYDLRRIEDVFACLEIISIARGTMFGVDPEMARRLEKVSDALGAFAQIVMEGGLVEQAPPAPAASASEPASRQTPPPQAPLFPGEQSDDQFTDLTVGGGGARKPSAKSPSQTDDDDGIIDILTGERIR